MNRRGFTLRKVVRGFTLLELLIVISIIAILSVIVILVLNPSEMLKKARDAQRMADLSTIKTAIGLYAVGTTTPYLGVGSTITGCTSGAKYIWFSKSGVAGTVDFNSIATSSASQNLAGKTDGSGWIPVNLKSLTGGSPLSNWPVDPVNSVSDLSSPSKTDLVYRYGCNSTNQFEVDATFESNAYTNVDNKRAFDGGDNQSLFEAGTNLSVMTNPFLVLGFLDGATYIGSYNVDSAVNLGQEWIPTVNGTVVALRLYVPATMSTAQRTLGLYDATGATLLGQVNLTPVPTSPGWQVANLGTPIAVTANTHYWVVAWEPDGYVKSGGQPSDNNGHDSRIQADTTNAEAYLYSGTLGFPTTPIPGWDYWIDVSFSPQ